MIGDSLRVHEEFLLLTRGEHGRIVGNAHHPYVAAAAILAELLLTIASRWSRSSGKPGAYNGLASGRRSGGRRSARTHTHVQTPAGAQHVG
jgi:hypothetical protein